MWPDSVVVAAPGFDQDLCLSQSVKDLPIQELITHRAIERLNSAFTGDITVAISDFSTDGGETLRLVGDESYRGLVTVTLAAVN